jgi:hypothetical protein
MKLTHRFRFALTQNTPIDGTLVLASDIARLFSVLYAVGGTFGEPKFRCLYGQTKIKSVDMYYAANVNPSGGLTSASVLWMSTDGNSGEEVSETSLSNTVPLHLRARPPRNYPAYFPQSATSSQPLFRFTALAGAIIDIVVEGVLQDGATPANYDGYATTAPNSALTFGYTCGGSLDQNASYLLGVKPSCRPIGLAPAYATYA